MKHLSAMYVLIYSTSSIDCQQIGAPDTHPDSGDGCKLFIYNLAKEVTDYELQPLFAPYYPKYVTVALGKKGTSRRFAFALFPNQYLAEAAQVALQGQYVCGRQIEIKRATAPEPERPSSAHEARPSSQIYVPPHVRHQYQQRFADPSGGPSKYEYNPTQPRSALVNCGACAGCAYPGGVCQRGLSSVFPRVTPREQEWLERQPHPHPNPTAPNTDVYISSRGLTIEVSRPPSRSNSRPPSRQSSRPPSCPLTHSGSRPPSRAPSQPLAEINAALLVAGDNFQCQALPGEQQSSTTQQWMPFSGPIPIGFGPAALSRKNLERIFLTRDRLSALCGVERLLAATAQGAQRASALAGMLVRVPQRKGYVLRRILATSYESEGRPMFMLEDMEQLVYLHNVSGTDPFASEYESERQELEDRCAVQGRVISRLEMALAVWRLETTTAWLREHGLKSTDAQAKALPELHALWEAGLDVATQRVQSIELAVEQPASATKPLSLSIDHSAKCKVESAASITGPWNTSRETSEWSIGAELDDRHASFPRRRAAPNSDEAKRQLAALLAAGAAQARAAAPLDALLEGSVVEPRQLFGVHPAPPTDEAGWRGACRRRETVEWSWGPRQPEKVWEDRRWRPRTGAEADTWRRDEERDAPSSAKFARGASRLPSHLFSSPEDEAAARLASLSVQEDLASVRRRNLFE